MNDNKLTVLVKSSLSTKFGEFQIFAFENADCNQMPHIALVSKLLEVKENVAVRIHSECMTGDLFGSHRCECGTQLHQSLKYISKEGGILVYLRQEGRGIGLVEKLKAYQLQDQGLDTIEANIQLGHAPDERSFDIAVQILQFLEIKSIRLLTNNPDKIKTIEESDIQLLERIPLIVEPNDINKDYIDTKKKLMGHLL